jgi:hypothetical protein
MLILSLLYDFATFQVDYTSVFTQAEIDKPAIKEKERSGV